MAPRSVEDLLHGHHEYLCFWGHRPTAGGSLGKGCLSQWWPAPFTLDDKTFATAEHYMMWRKATLFGDTGTAARILRADHPAQAKDLGREVRDFDNATWEQARYDVVVAASTAKFGADPALRAYLLATGDRVLVEASPTDRVWGIGRTADDPAARDPRRWRGLNLLGFALMAAREALAHSGD
jgi:ribA/ribD-fused uncharacterized protein